LSFLFKNQWIEVASLPKVDFGEMQQLIEKLEGVIAAKVVFDDDGPCEIHVLSDKGKNPKQLSRDIQSALSAASGVSIEHKIISIAQIGEDLKSEVRLKVNSLDISYDSCEFCATVSLLAGEKLYAGSARSGMGMTAHRTAVSKACIEAVNQFVGAKKFSLYGIQIISESDISFAHVMVSFNSGDYEKLLSGTAIIKSDEYYSVMSATLDALNRTIGKGN
jgi:hypothetical protein